VTRQYAVFKLVPLSAPIQIGEFDAEITKEQIKKIKDNITLLEVFEEVFHEINEIIKNIVEKLVCKDTIFILDYDDFLKSNNLLS
jgi:hypothetical protein